MHPYPASTILHPHTTHIKNQKLELLFSFLSSQANNQPTQKIIIIMIEGGKRIGRLKPEACTCTGLLNMCRQYSFLLLADLARSLCCVPWYRQRQRGFHELSSLAAGAGAGGETLVGSALRTPNQPKDKIPLRACPASNPSLPSLPPLFLVSCQFSPSTSQVPKRTRTASYVKVQVRQSGRHMLPILAVVCKWTRMATTNIVAVINQFIYLSIYLFFVSAKQKHPVSYPLIQPSLHLP